MTNHQSHTNAKTKRRRRMSTPAKFGLATLVLGAAGAGGFAIWPNGPDFGAVRTSQTQEFQDEDVGGGFARIEPPEEVPAEAPTAVTFDTSGLEAEFATERERLEAQNQALSASVAALQERLDAMAAGDAGAQDAAIASAMAEIQAQNAGLATTINDLQSQLEAANLDVSDAVAAERQRAEEALRLAKEELEADRANEVARLDGEARRREQVLREELAALQSELRNGINDAMTEAELERQRLAAETELEAQRRAELERRRQEANALAEAQITSNGVIFDAGGSTPSSGTGGGADAGSDGPITPDQAGRGFVMDGASAVQVTSAEIIANPGNTIIQGTIIEATLETAIDSSLPGQIASVVNRPVYSFDGSQILIPPGTRLFGQYSSDVSLGQQRILVGWTRLVTPDGQSVQLAAFGADQQGRSGLTGDVDNRFALRFGSAALLSVIGAVPSIAAAQAGSETGLEVAEQVGSNFERTTQSVIGQYAALPPIITLQPGAAITVIVDRDIELY